MHAVLLLRQIDRRGRHIRVSHLTDRGLILELELLGVDIIEAGFPIASNGDLPLMPPATGLPVARSASPIGDIFESIPHAPDPAATHESTTHG